MRPILSPWSQTFETFARSIHNQAIIVTPFVTAQPLRHFATLLDSADPPQISILTNLDTDSLIQGSVDGKAIADFCTEIPTTTIRHIPGLHAKAYIADDHMAIVTSGNLTSGSLYRNYEYGIQVNDSVIVRRIAADLREYGNLGVNVPLEELRRISEIATTLKNEQIVVLNSAREDLKQRTNSLLQGAHESLMQLRSMSGESTNSIFGRTICYLLKSRSLTTEELHPLVQSIHPDLCDDKIDRVINGVRFGREWKHRVRGAQVTLKRRGLIELVEGRWRLRPK